MYPTTNPAPHLVDGVIPCCVPSWDSQAFFKEGGRFNETLGFHVLEDDYLANFEDWLPRRWQFRGNPPAPCLLPDMLPESAWQDNLRTRLTPQEWDRLRKFCYAAAGFTCVACGSRGEPHVEAHEVWRFDVSTQVQSLKAILCLCPTCHKAKHLGYANRIGKLAHVYARLKWLNDWSDADLKAELEKVEARQAELSAITWTLDLSFLRTYGVR